MQVLLAGHGETTVRPSPGSAALAPAPRLTDVSGLAVDLSARQLDASHERRLGLAEDSRAVRYRTASSRLSAA
jgi:hypothetical protein